MHYLFHELTKSFALTKSDSKYVTKTYTVILNPQDSSKVQHVCTAWYMIFSRSNFLLLIIYQDYKFIKLRQFAKTPRDSNTWVCFECSMATALYLNLKKTFLISVFLEIALARWFFYFALKKAFIFVIAVVVHNFHLIKKVIIMEVHVNEPNVLLCHLVHLLMSNFSNLCIFGMYYRSYESSLKLHFQ